MPRVKFNPLVDEIQGTLGNATFRRTHTGRVILSKKPDMSNVKWSKAQKEHRQRFKQAVAYAHAAMADEKVHANYVKAAAKLGKRPFDLAVSDYFKGKNLLKGV